jgi:hypothetical protein
MQITAIKYLLSNETEPTILRFAVKGGGRRNLFCHQGTAENIKKVAQAITSCLSPEPLDSGYKYAMVFLLDENGDVWGIEKKGETRNFYKNSKKINGDIRGTALYTMLDMDQNSIPNEADFGCRILEIVNEGKEFQALQVSGLSLANSGFGRTITSKSRELIQLCNEKMAPTKELSLSEINAFVPQLESLFNRSFDIKEVYKSLKNDLGIHKIDNESVEKSEKELLLIERIKKIVDNLSDPASGTSLLREKMTACEQRLNEICQELGIDPQVFFESTFDFRELLASFAKLKTAEFVAREITGSVQRLSGEITPMLDTLLDTVTNILENESQIIAELQNCLEKNVAASQGPLPHDNLIDKLSKKVFSFFTPLATQEGAGPSDPLPEVMVNHNQMALEYGKARLHEIRSSLPRLKPTVLSSLSSLQKFQDKLSGQIEISRQEWGVLFGKQDGTLPAHDHAQMTSFIEKCAHAIFLQKMCTFYENSLESTKVAFKELEELITAWRSITGSQKQIPLDRKSIILSEARGISSYLEQKKSKVEKIRRLQVQNNTVAAIHRQFKKTFAEVADAWSALCSQYHLTGASIEDPSWSDFFKKAGELLPYSGLCQAQGAPLPQDKIFNVESFETPLTLFTIISDQLSNNQRIQLLAHIEKSPTFGLGLLMTSDATLYEMMQKIGITPSSLVKQRSEKEASAPVSAMTKKAEEILQLLAVKKEPSREIKKASDKQNKNGVLHKNSSSY